MNHGEKLTMSKKSKKTGRRQSANNPKKPDKALILLIAALIIVIVTVTLLVLSLSGVFSHGGESDGTGTRPIPKPQPKSTTPETTQVWEAGDDFLAAHYVRPESAGLTAPAHKRNLLVLEIESMETTMFTKKQGGVWDKEVIPELFDLLWDDDAVFFASDYATRGALDGYMTKWTMASLIANTSGIPFIIPPEQNNSYRSDDFLYGAYSLGDVLKDNGYRNVLITATRASFGGVREYFTRHGDYEIIDMNNVGDYGLSYPASQSNEWGFSDEASLMLARDMMTRLESESEQPWHLFVSTVDCHFNGYLYDADPAYGYEGSANVSGRQLENVYATTSREVGQLISWLKQQPFYEDTTVVIIGDHTNMMSSFCAEKDNDSRGRYNLILNGERQPCRVVNRVFTAFDLYPTMLSALGFEIPGSRLGIGTDLYSSVLTLAEEYGLDGMNAALEEHKSFYIENLMGADDWKALEDKARREGHLD